VADTRIGMRPLPAPTEAYHPGTTGGFTQTAPKADTGNFFNQPPEPMPGTILNVAADAVSNVTERLGTAKQRRIANILIRLRWNRANEAATGARLWEIRV
jgi:hypothetical protein